MGKGIAEPTCRIWESYSGLNGCKQRAREGGEVGEGGWGPDVQLRNGDLGAKGSR